MENPRIAISVFVKTPGLSPLKTRLAKEIGTPLAESFHRQSCLVVRDVLQELCQRVESVFPIWAVAEPDALGSEMWKDFPCVQQGEGGLGDRLKFVYESLKAKYDGIAFLGADCPQLSIDSLQRAISQVREKQAHVIGPSLDGGYYFFGSCLPVSSQVWTKVPYSVDQTASVFIQELEKTHPVQLLEPLQDVDTCEDLKALVEYGRQASGLISSQSHFLTWVQQTLLVR